MGLVLRLSVLVLTAFVVTSYANDKEVKLNPFETTGEVDPAYGEVDPAYGDVATEKGACNPEINRWPNGKVPYALCDELVKAHKDKIELAMRMIESYPGNPIEFIDVADQVGDCDNPGYSGHFLKIGSKEEGCWSYIGQIASMNGQDVNYASACFTTDVISHELLHALGLNHINKRPDSETHIQVNWENIKDGMADQFTTGNTICTKCPYSPCSYMHYGPEYFSKNGQQTITDKDNKKLDMIMSKPDTSKPAEPACDIDKEYGVNEQCATSCELGSDWYGNFPCCYCSFPFEQNVDPTCSKLRQREEYKTDEDGVDRKQVIEYHELGSSDSVDISSPKDSSGNYESNMDWYCLIKCPGSSRVKLEFITFNVEGDTDTSCNWDSYKLWKGTSYHDCPVMECDTTHPALSGESDSNFAYMKLSSDESVQERGVELKATCIG